MSMHPDLKKDIIHEQRKLFNYRSARHAELNYFDEYSSIVSGEKIPYLGNYTMITQYIDKFREFWPNSMLFHIVRDPGDCAKSSNRRFNRPIDGTKVLCERTQSRVNNYIMDKGNYTIVCYEELIADPVSVIASIYKAMGNVPSKDYIKKVATTKKPWYCLDKRCCGLRYYDAIGKVNHGL
jgi:hypothetical protein